jgi:hypothetical protein
MPAAIKFAKPSPPICALYSTAIRAAISVEDIRAAVTVAYNREEKLTFSSVEN